MERPVWDTEREATPDEDASRDAPSEREKRVDGDAAEEVLGLPEGDTLALTDAMALSVTTTLDESALLRVPTAGVNVVPPDRVTRGVAE